MVLPARRRCWPFSRGRRLCPPSRATPWRRLHGEWSSTRNVTFSDSITGLGHIDAAPRRRIWVNSKLQS
jgi:hypothetical protein